ncbi:site-specific integrase [Agrobacterium sp.]|uniref:tyrosine-type recombinase/integrase n=1 Tax=Agrobacterium sp. TaxID=361 RepID=UPI0028AF6199|nr:site-specific integrase [Agrobacterium sp.]
MVTVELKGIHTVKAKGITYYYAWRGGPRLNGEPGTPAFMASYNEAVANRTEPENGRFRSIITNYKATAFKKVADSTKRVWTPWIDKISIHFGDLSIAQFNRPDKIRPRIRQWRGQYADTPRAADTGMQVLSRILSHGVDPMGVLSSNPAEGIKHLYSSDRSEIIWTDADIAQVKAVASEEVQWVIDLAAHTGLRIGDLLKLSWSHIGADAIVMTTGKSKKKREALIPRYDALNEVLDRIHKRSPVILTSTKKQPWKQDGFNTMFWRAKEKANMLDRDLHFHDLRGTAATKFYIAGLSVRVIAEVMAWEEATVEKIIRRYVGRQSATKEMIRQLNEARTRT